MPIDDNRHRPPVVLAIVGSTQFKDGQQALDAAADLINDALDRLTPTRVVSGSAAGIDQLAAELARARGIDVTEYPPRTRRWAPAGYAERNLLIATDCTHLLRITCRASRTYGSGWTADRAEEMGKRVQRFTLLPD